MRTVIGIYYAVEDGFQAMPDYQYLAFLSATLGILLIIGSAIGSVGYGLGWW